MRSAIDLIAIQVIYQSVSLSTPVSFEIDLNAFIKFHNSSHDFLQYKMFKL